MKRYVTLTLLFAAIARADDYDTWFAASPDKKLVAVERRVPDSGEPSRLDLDSFTVFVCTAADGIERLVIAQRTFPGRIVSQIRWSPDSQFLLFTTASSGGHSPWHFKTFVFCAADKSFRDVETAAGAPVGAPDFQFESADIAILKLLEPSSETPKVIKLPLGKAMQQMERLLKPRNASSKAMQRTAPRSMFSLCEVPTFSSLPSALSGAVADLVSR